MNTICCRVIASIIGLCCSVVIPLAGLDFSQPASACGIANRDGARVRVAEESAIIVWDAGSKVQHFIRRATFDADTPDFAFLVPTPTQPALSESKDEAFAHLEKLIVPKVVTRYDLVPNIGCGGATRSTNTGVQVLEQGRVAGFNYKIFEADTAKNLYDWLITNDYVAGLNLRSWVEPYVEKKWKFTVFKIAKDANKQEVATSAVRMSFSTEKPFFPYSEPMQKSAANGRRLLRVFFVGEKRYAGVLGEDNRWPGGTVWAAPLQPESLQKLATMLNLPPNLQSPWLTVFEDHSSPRSGTNDVYFEPSSEQTEVYGTVYVREDLSGLTCLGICLIFILMPIMLGLRRRSRVA